MALELEVFLFGVYMKQEKLFIDKIDLIQVDSVIGSGYEEDVAKLAIEDKIAYRAARKNMQIHSAIILKINDKDEVIIEKCGFHYKTAFEHGFKHGVESEKEKDLTIKA